MAENETIVEPEPEPQVEPEVVDEGVADVRPDRGSLTITDHALRRIAGQVALGVPGVAPTSPRVDWQRLGLRARVSLEVSLVWPASAAVVTREVQEAVGRELVRQAAQELDAVSVAVRDVERPPRAAPAPRVR
ncbi:Asp23/Gls24 family envelope stress response protein [Cellulomonas composti]|uniref:Asp23/Gls24 family envelope stress response protein n=1 Tax=Cellulomonas composti TaxID=266130 RepID=UPI0011BE79A2|nr:Asp23/Gls24 family envelope stress response protein [Cellulomonas composti]